MKTCIIIVTYNAMAWIDKCLTSSYEQGLPTDVFVVDNGSTDGTQDYIKTNFPEAFFFQSGINLGFGKANNLGFEYALKNGYDYVYLLNQDAWLEKDTIQQLVAIQKRYPKYGILSPVQMTKDFKFIDRNLTKSLGGDDCPHLISDLYNNTLKDVYSIKFVMAAHWLISCDCLKIIGGFAPIFPHYGEDDNYIQRALFFNYQVGICPHLKVVHDRGDRVDCIDKIIHLSYTSKFLKTACDINNNAFFSLLKAYTFLFKDFFIFLFRERRMLKPLINVFKGVFSLFLILKSRCFSKRKQTPFLFHN
jgi:Predicted glycosyltransferases